MAYDPTAAGVIGGTGGNLTAYDPYGNGAYAGGAGAWGSTGSEGSNPYGPGGSAWGAMGGTTAPTSTSSGSQSSSGSNSGGSTGTSNGSTTNTQTAMDPALWAAFSGGLQNAIANPGTPDSVTQGIINKGTDQLSEAQKSSAIDLSNRANAMGAGQSGGLQGAMGTLDASYAGQKTNLARDTELAAEQAAQDRELQALNIASHEPMNTTGTTTGGTTNNYYGSQSSSGSDTQTAPASYGKTAQSMGFGSGMSAGPANKVMGGTSAQFPQGYMAVQGRSGGGNMGFGEGTENAGMAPDGGPDANANSWGQQNGQRTAW